MADNEITIVVSDRDKTDPTKVRAKWKAAQKGMAADSKAGGEEAGKQFGEGFTRGADGKLRDSQGKFIPGGGGKGGGGGGFRPEGEKSGKSWMSGFANAFGGGGGAKKIEGAVTGMFAISAKTAATAFSAQFVGSVVAGLASGAAKLAHGLGAMVALLPAAAMAGVAAMVALKLAVAGVGDALGAAVTGDAKEFDEAIKGLAPSARGFAREVRGMRTEIKGLQQGVQQSFFEKFSGDTKKLGATYLPMVKNALSGIAGSFGKAAHESAGFLNSSKTSGVLAMTLGHVRAAVGNVAGALPSLVRAFVPLVAVGSTFLPKLTSGFRHAAESLANMSESGQRSGGIAKFIQGGIDKLKSLWDTAKQVGRVIGNVFDIFSQFKGTGGIFAALGIQTGGLLDSLELLSAKAKAFFETAAGGQAITEIFSIIQSLLSATMGTLAHVATILGRVFAPILPQLSKMAEATANFQLALADGLEPALQAVADVLAVVLPVATDVMNVMAGNKTVMAGLAGALVGLYVAWKAVSAISKIAKSDLSAAKIGAGGAVTAITAISMALIQMDAAEHKKQLDNLTEGFLAMDGAVNTTTKGMIYIAQLSGQLDEVMRSLIDANPRLAQEYINNGAALGMTTEQQARYQAQLDQTTAATENATDALTRQKDALRGMTDPVFAAIDAQSRLTEAQQHLAELQESGTATAADLAQAHEDVARASADNTGALYDLGIAAQNGDTSLSAVIGTLKRQVKQGDITKESYNQLALTAAARFAAIAGHINAVPRMHTTTLTVADYASAAASGVRNLLASLHDKHITISLGMAAGAGVGAVLARFAHGGITGAAGGGPRSGATWVGEHGPELVDLAPGTRVHSNPDSMRLAAQAGGGGPTTLLLKSDGTPMMNLLMELLRKAIKVEHGGDVQVALGS